MIYLIIVGSTVKPIELVESRTSDLICSTINLFFKTVDMTLWDYTTSSSKFILSDDATQFQSVI